MKLLKLGLIMRIVEIFFAKAERGHPLSCYLLTVVVKIFTTNFLQLLACEATSQLRVVERIFGLNYTTTVSEAAVSRMSHFLVYDLRHHPASGVIYNIYI